MSDSAQTKIDPELTRQLHQAEGPVAAVCMLRPCDPTKPITADAAEKLTHEVLDRVRKITGHATQDVNVFRNLGSFAVSAAPSFLKVLLDQPEIASAMANRRPQSMMIKPHDVRTVDSKAIGRENLETGED